MQEMFLRRLKTNAKGSLVITEVIRFDCYASSNILRKTVGTEGTVP